MGSVDGANRSLDWIASFGATQVVPGHGPVISAAELPEVIAQHRAYYEFVRGSSPTASDAASTR